MHTLSTKNVNTAYATIMPGMRFQPEHNSRNGMVKSFDSPVMVEFLRPDQRVLFNPLRDANPTFHLVEAMWMLAGRNDVAFIERFNSRMGEFSDDGITFNAAYGFRWRTHFGYDQLERAAGLLLADPDTRRCVVTIWDPTSDLGTKSNDIPCNQQCMFRIVDGKLNMLTTNRSNDLVWGLLGANYVHLTVMMEYMAGRTGYELGTWTHVSNNLHVYERHWPLLGDYGTFDMGPMPYPKTIPLLPNNEWQDFDEDCKDMVGGQDDDFRTPFFDDVVAPMVQAWELWRNGHKAEALNMARCIGADDWRQATVAWYRRRMNK